MTVNRIIGLVLVLIGVGLLIVGLNSSHSLTDQVSNTFTGRFTDATNWYIFGGGALALVGLATAFIGAKGKSA